MAQRPLLYNTAKHLAFVAMEKGKEKQELTRHFPGCADVGRSIFRKLSDTLQIKTKKCTDFF
jgi:hypothetical protein